MTTFSIVVTLFIIVLGAFLWLRRRTRAIVDGAVIRVSHDSHCTAIVQYREGQRTVRFGAEIVIPQAGETALRVDVPETMYSDAGDVIPADDYEVLKQRLSRGLTKLGIAHELLLA